MLLYNIIYKIIYIYIFMYKFEARRVHDTPRKSRLFLAFELGQ